MVVPRSDLSGSAAAPTVPTVGTSSRPLLTGFTQYRQQGRWGGLIRHRLANKTVMQNRNIGVQLSRQRSLDVSADSGRSGGPSHKSTARPPARNRRCGPPRSGKGENRVTPVADSLNRLDTVGVADVVLIHSTGQGAAGWKPVVEALGRRGMKGNPVELPYDQSMTATDFACLVREQAGPASAPVVLAHSGSGPLLPSVARLLGAAHQVWLAAWVPAADMPFTEDVRAHLAEAFDAAWVGKDPIADDAVAREFLYHDCDEAALQWALTTRRSFYPAAVYQQVLSLAREVPSTYIVATEDRTIRPAWQRRMARERLGVEPMEMVSGHCPNVSQPERLADLILACGG
jgi:pimeloyl-ACP methyl ester carboxylesterase